MTVSKGLTLMLLLGVTLSWGGKIQILCPEFCNCDVFENLRRAVCANKKLVSIELNVPPQAEILDLSNNKIQELGDKIFLQLGLTNLQLLNISHNMLSHIHFNGFIGLENLKVLDLSFNALEYFTQSWFESLQSLEELYLKGNKLRSINEEARIDLSKLKILDISQCGITRLKAETFDLVPNLENLDISDNFIQSIQVDVFKMLPKLHQLKAEHNNFNCKDSSLTMLEPYIKNRQMVFTTGCSNTSPVSFSINNRAHKFEKMIMLDDVTTTPSSINKNSNNSWIVEDGNSKNNNTVVECNSTDTAPQSIGDKTLLMEIIQLSPWLIVTIIFVYGVLCGMVITCCISMCIHNDDKRHRLKEVEVPDGSVHTEIRASQSVPNLTNKSNKRNVRRSNSVLYRSLHNARVQRAVDMEDESNETLVLNEFDVATSTPMTTRKLAS